MDVKASFFSKSFSNFFFFLIDHIPKGLLVDNFELIAMKVIGKK